MKGADKKPVKQNPINPKYFELLEKYPEFRAMNPEEKTWCYHFIELLADMQIEQMQRGVI